MEPPHVGSYKAQGFKLTELLLAVLNTWTGWTQKRTGRNWMGIRLERAHRPGHTFRLAAPHRTGHAM